MIYLARLKNLKGATTLPTKPTKPHQTAEKVGFVGFVGCPPAHIEKSRPSLEASNDPGHPPKKAPNKDRPASHETESPEWRALDAAYQAHHFHCPTCVAAGKGYGIRCGAGAALWRTYAEHREGGHG